MSFVGKIKNLIGLEEEDYYDDEFMSNDFADPELDEPVVSGKRSKVVNIHATTQLKVVVMQPEDFDDARAIADHLKTKRPVIINLEDLDTDIARRVVDFLSGAAYGVDGNIQKISAGIFLVAPYNVSIMGDFRDELRSKSIFHLG